MERFWPIGLVGAVGVIALMLTVDVWLHPRACPHGPAVSHTVPSFGCAP